jgi:DNA polymerase-3 subunit delta
LFEIRMPSGKPDKGAELLLELATQPPPDVVCLITTEKLDRKASEAAWVRAIERQGVFVPVWPVDRAALPQWLRERAQALGARMEEDAAQLIVERVEGNLLAAKQELEKLALLAAGRPIDAALVLSAVGDSARYDVFQLGEAAAAGDGERALRILFGLKSEGVEPPLILWALVRELRGLFQARERERLRTPAAASAWNQAARPSPRAIARLPKLPLAELLRQASSADRIIKGMAQGDAWTEIIGLTARFAGALQAPTDSGRVAV